MINASKSNNRVYIKWICCICVLIPLLFLNVESNIKTFIVITVWAILMWMFELLPDHVVGLLLPVLYVVFGVADASTAFSSWLSTTPWTTIGGLMVGTAFVSSGFVKRLAYKILLLTRGTFGSIVISMALTCIIITPIIPSVMAKVALMTPIAIGLCDILGVEKKSREASALMLTVFYALWSPKMAFLTASADSILAAGILSKVAGVNVTWMGWAMDMFVPAILWTALSVALVFLLKPKKIKIDKTAIREKYEELGAFSAREKRVVTMGVILIALLMTDSLHNIDAAWIIMLAGCISFVPKVGVLEPAEFSKISFSIVFFLVGAMSIGAVTQSLGIADAVAAWFTPVLEGRSPLVLIMSIYLFALIVNFVLNPLALAGTLMGPLAGVCESLGYPAVLGGYAMIMGFNQALLPYQIAPLMFIYSFGYIRMGHLTRLMIARMVVGIVFMIIVAYPYWKICGLV